LVYLLSSLLHTFEHHSQCIYHTLNIYQVQTFFQIQSTSA